MRNIVWLDDTSCRSEGIIDSLDLNLPKVTHDVDQ
jgi:hypothetical protein